MTISEIQDLTKPIDGLLHQNGENFFEGEVLYHLSHNSKGKIVEIGSWKGKSTIWLCKGSASGYKQAVYAINSNADSEEHRPDSKPMSTYDAFVKNVSHAGVAQYVVPLFEGYLEAFKDIPGRVGFIFIDGLSDYHSSKEIFEAWLPKVEIGGVMAFHDTFGHSHPGVRKLIHEEIFKSPIFKNVRYINSITYATKVSQTTFSDRLKNRLALFMKIVHEISLDLPQPFRSLIKRWIWQPFQKKWLNDLR